MNPLVIFPKNTKETNREYAYSIIRHNIMMLNLYPGETLNEAAISELLNVSRTPVHEALILLQNQNLVTVVPQSGSHVSLISLKKVNEGLFLRETLEPSIYRQIAGIVPSQYLNAMKENLQQHRELLALKDSDQFDVNALIELDNSFHRLAYYAAQKDTIWSSVQTVSSHYDRIRYQGYISKEDNADNIYEEHLALFTFLMLGDTPDFKLEEFYPNHISHFKKTLPKFYFEHPEYFTAE